MNNQIQRLIDEKALFVVNHSGGKDSQAMHIKIRQMVPVEQILVIHANLPGVEWEGTEKQVYDTTKGFKTITVQAGKTFFEMVEKRTYWPSPKFRQCTSDLKTGPIEKAIRHYLKENEQHNKKIVNCMGIRSQESCMRAKRESFKLSVKNSRAGREWFDWLPIFDMSEVEVFAMIKEAGEKPHWAYAAGMSRLSCAFCIMSSKKDLVTAAKLNPELYVKYCEMEKKIDQTFVMPSKKHGRQFLPQVTGVAPLISIRA